MEKKTITWIIAIGLCLVIFVGGGYSGWLFRGYQTRSVVDSVRSEYTDSTERLDKLSKYTGGLEQLLSNNEHIIDEYREQISNLTNSTDELQSLYDELRESNNTIRAELIRAEGLHEQDVIRNTRDAELILESRRIIEQIKLAYGYEPNSNK